MLFKVIPRTLEEVKKSESGLLSINAGKIPVFGETLKYNVEKLVLRINDVNTIINRKGLRLGKGLYLSLRGEGLYLSTKTGSGLFSESSPA